ncbi:ABC transporter ATP-binding protein [Xinfangfangia sp. D13-10-4-6]|uniref:putative B6 ABC transporter ATP-binding protein n=1 Tax=Pseudogemmobacter hezensis TaxID=2737662 RepID=UPI0015552B17|nr:ABC transporter ATP-binding protein [Pseudogemmobacter hezensis]NPD16365.1 ABC transporter ATP-binding protein [Pseudogemmobacter hezensis]
MQTPPGAALPPADDRAGYGRAGSGVTGAGIRPVVALQNVTRRFPGVLASDAVSLGFLPGEVHVLLGENGAGKSTLVAMLSGLQQPDAGQILIDGAAVSLAAPRDALRLGIGTVFQHSMLVPSLSVVDNFTLGGPWWQRPDRKALAARIQAAAAGPGLRVDPFASVASLSLGERQQAEILRALMRGSRCLILDEATAMLTPQEAGALGALMRRLAATGLAVVFITHKLQEALAFGDRITVLRGGRNVGMIAPDVLQARSGAENTAHIVSLMFGEDSRRPDPLSHDLPRPAPPQKGPALLKVAGLSTAGGPQPLRDISFTLHAGEIFGIAGIDGNGQKALAEALAGQIPSTGTLHLGGAEINGGVAARRRAGLSYVTDDRLGEGIVAGFPVATNLVLKEIGQPPFWRRGLVQSATIAAAARALVQAFDIRTPDVTTPAGRLSGGNIQKVLLARELTGQAQVVIFAKPTYGLDLQNITAIRARIREAAGHGKAVLLISTDLDELLELSDRIAVIERGRLSPPYPNDDTARAAITRLISGATGGADV